MPGALTDVGEFILKASLGSPINEDKGVKYALSHPEIFQVRVRPNRTPVPAAFQGLTTAPAPSVPPGFESAIRCPSRPKGAMMYLPFAC